MYTISEYGNMYAHKARANAFADALRRAVTPGCIVLDIGTGTGIFALLACRYGAGHVYAIEPDGAINLARQLAAANGYSDRITFFQKLSTEVDLPERADVIIWDMSGVLPLNGRHIATVADARQRFLAPGGTLIPQQDHLRAAIVEATQLHVKLEEPWRKDLLTLDLSAGWALVANTPVRPADGQVRCLTLPSTIASLDYRTVEDDSLNCELAWTFDWPGTAHGAAVWFDRILADGITISNEPGAPESISTSKTYGQLLFPWPNAVDIEPGDRISLCLKANLVKEEYFWRWETVIHAGNRTKAHFCQSSLQGQPISFEYLTKREAQYVPEANDEARIDAFICSKVDGQTSLSQIARDVAANFPSRFKDWQDALSRVGDVTNRYQDQRRNP